jgi:hypothetical protein
MEKDANLLIGVDGEFYEVSDCQRLNVFIDKKVPRLKILKRTTRPGGASHENPAASDILTEMKSYQPTIM